MGRQFMVHDFGAGVGQGRGRPLAKSTKNTENAKSAPFNLPTYLSTDYAIPLKVFPSDVFLPKGMYESRKAALSTINKWVMSPRQLKTRQNNSVSLNPQA
jgi:hypothetical protein